MYYVLIEWSIHRYDAGVTSEVTMEEQLCSTFKSKMIRYANSTKGINSFGMSLPIIKYQFGSFFHRVYIELDLKL
jgi:hypothetical protein